MKKEKENGKQKQEKRKEGKVGKKRRKRNKKEGECKADLRVFCLSRNNCSVAGIVPSKSYLHVLSLFLYLDCHQLIISFS